MFITKYYGPPGSGKTRKGIDIVQRELRTIPLSEIAFITFTKSAIQEACERLEAKGLYFKTLHAICFYELGLEKGQVVEDLSEFSELIGEKITVKGFMLDVMTEADEVLSCYNAGRNKRIDTNDDIYRHLYQGNWNQYRFQYLIDGYKRWKEINDYLDFTDFLYNYLNLGDPLDIKACIVDEAQDLSLLQKAVIEKMTVNCERVYLLGDDDQAIYNWAGADADSFLNWKCDKEIVLDRSYRLSIQVKKHADRIIERVKNRKEKSFTCKGDIGHVDWLNNIEDTIQDSTFILYRNRYFHKRFKEHLEFNGEPYTGYGSPFDSVERKAIILWNKIISNVFTVKDLQQAVKFIKHGLINSQNKKKILAMTNLNDVLSQKDTSIFQFDSWDKSLDLSHEAYFDKIINKYGFNILVEPPKVKLMTLHQSKGQEADTVYILPDMSRRTYANYMIEPDNEHRLFYVGCTRAKQNLIILFNQTDKFYR